ncbi:MAG: hypothetical protein SW833_17545 [Cyanobacteriota bacterium]|nr:hypothetical protein [Cyanobacteriota bacterium]
MNELQNDLIAELSRKFEERSFEQEEPKSYGEQDIDLLKATYHNLLKKENFEVGQIVKWKENLKNRKLPYSNQPAIVVSLLDEPVVSNEEDSGSPYFLEPLDIVLGLLTDDKIFLTFYYDSRRFEPY